jgi:hypothetical protein
VPLTYTTTREVLRSAFPSRVAREMLGVMIETGAITRTHGSPVSPANAVVAMLGCALYREETGAGVALKAAMSCRDWKATAPAPGRRMALGYTVSHSLGEIKALRVLCGQIYVDRPSAWSVSAIELIGGGLCFSATNYGDHGGRTPDYIKRDPVTVPAWLIAELSRHYGHPTEAQRQQNEQLLSRINRFLRPEERIAEAAE